jgi:hypothetical protein
VLGRWFDRQPERRAAQANAAPVTVPPALVAA